MTALLEHPGRVRIVVDEDDGETQLGLLWGFRSRHYSSDATAALAYEAEALTPLDAAAIATVTGASGGGSNNVVQHSNLGVGWTPVLSTEHATEGHLTHVGTYRVWARVYTTNTTPPELRFVWDVGDLAMPAENAAVTIPGSSDLYLIDCGEVRLDPVRVGTHRWQGVFSAKGEIPAKNIAVDKVWFQPIDEGAFRVSASLVSDPGLAAFTGRDEFQQASAALSGATASVGGTWGGAGDSDDFAIVGAEDLVRRTAVSDSSDRAGRYAPLGSTSYTDTAVQVDFRANNYVARQGLILRYAGSTAALIASVDDGAILRLTQVTAGGQTSLASLELASDLLTDTWYTLRAVAFESGLFALWLRRTAAGLAFGEPDLVGRSAVLATGGAREDGLVGIYDANKSATASTRDYTNFAAWVPDSDAVLYAGQSAEIRYDGVARASADGSGYGPLIPIGDLPRIPPSGLEGRPVELFIKASRGDLQRVPDSGIDDISARVMYRPSWLFPS